MMSTWPLNTAPSWTLISRVVSLPTTLAVLVSSTRWMPSMLPWTWPSILILLALIYGALLVPK